MATPPCMESKLSHLHIEFWRGVLDWVRGEKPVEKAVWPVETLPFCKREQAIETLQPSLHSQAGNTSPQIYNIAKR